MNVSLFLCFCRFALLRAVAKPACDNSTLVVCQTLILLYCALANWQHTSQFKIRKLTTLQEICAPAGLWFKNNKKIKVSTFVLASCFRHPSLLSLSFWFGPLLVCYWANHGFPWNASVGSVTEQELSQHIAPGIEQLEWALAFLSIFWAWQRTRSADTDIVV